MEQSAQDINNIDDGRRAAPPGLLSGLGLMAGLAALAGASCCALPLVLAMLGLGGAWLASFSLFIVFRPYIISAALLIIAIGWLLALRRTSTARTRLALGVATALVCGALLISEYEPEITRYLVSLRR